MAPSPTAGSWMLWPWHVLRGSLTRASPKSLWRCRMHSTPVVIYISLPFVFSGGDWQQVVRVFSSHSGDNNVFYCPPPTSPPLPVSKWRNYNRMGESQCQGAPLPGALSPVRVAVWRHGDSRDVTHAGGGRGMRGWGGTPGRDPTAAQPWGAVGEGSRTATGPCPLRPRRSSAKPAEKRVPSAVASAARGDGRGRGQGDGRGRGDKSGSGMQTQVLWGHACGDKDGDREVPWRARSRGRCAHEGSAPRTSRRARRRRRLLPFTRGGQTTSELHPCKYWLWPSSSFLRTENQNVKPGGAGLLWPQGCAGCGAAGPGEPGLIRGSGPGAPADTASNWASPLCESAPAAPRMLKAAGCVPAWTAGSFITLGRGRGGTQHTQEKTGKRGGRWFLARHH